MEAWITITGNVGSDVEIRAGGNNDWAFANFRVACTPRSRGADGWQDDPTIWYRVSCGFALANHVKASVGRGDPVIVVGRLRTVTWVDSDGVTRSRTEIEARRKAEVPRVTEQHGQVPEEEYERDSEREPAPELMPAVA